MTRETIQRLRDLDAQARQGGGRTRIQRQHAKGKFTARERLEILLDPGTFSEIGAFARENESDSLGDSVVTGWGRVRGRPVYVFAQDFTVLGGSVGAAHGRKICQVMDLALANGAPIIGLNDSGGARIQEGVDALAAYGEIFYRNTICSGVIPQISVILGPCAGGAVYSPAITDFTFMVRQTGHMFITGPEVLRTVTHEDVTFEALGGAEAHGQKSGVAHFVSDDEEAVLAEVQRLLDYLPSNHVDEAPWREPSDPPDRLAPELDEAVPEAPDRAYDMRRIIQAVADDGDFLEVHAAFAPNLLVGFARLGGYPVGLVAQQPETLAGVLDIDASDKGARFIRFCDCFNIPLVTLTDTPGFLPGLAQEHGGIIRHGAKMIFAYAEATVPKVAVVVRKAYGGAYIVMSSKHLRGDVNLAWPGAEIAVMGPEGAVNILHRKELSASDDPGPLRSELSANYRKQFANPYVAAARVASGEALIGMAALDTAMSAHKGTGKFKGRPVKKVRIMSVLFPTYQSWGVTFKSGIKTMADMNGKRISVGKAGATTERNARELLAAAGLKFDNLSKKEYLGWSQSVQAMKDGKLDGGLFQGSPPTAALVDLYTSKRGFIISLTDSEVKKMEAAGVMYRVALKPGTYPNQDKSIQTVARQNLFIVSADAPDDLVYSLTKIMYENLAYLKRAYHGFKPIDPKEPFAGTYNSGLKAHPGAIKYFQEKGVNIPKASIP